MLFACEIIGIHFTRYPILYENNVTIMVILVESVQKPCSYFIK